MRGGLARNLNSNVKASFCQQVDDWMLLKTTEKIIQRNVFEQKKKKLGLSADRPSNSCALYNIYCTSETKSSFDTPDALWPVSPQITRT